MSRALLVAVALLLEPSLLLAANRAVAPHFTAELVAESRTPAPGKRLTVALVINPEPGWHIYWKNPGETGFPPQPKWSLPAGIRAGALRHPVPSELIVDGLSSNVHEGKVALLTDLMLSNALPAGATIPVGLNVRLAICSKGQCIPHKVALDQALITGDGTPEPGLSRFFKEARAALPAALAKPGRYAVNDKTLKLFLPLPGVNDIHSAHVFFDRDGIVAHGEQRFTIDSGELSVIMARNGIPVNLPLSGVVRIVHTSHENEAGNVKGYRFIAGPRKTK